MKTLGVVISLSIDRNPTMILSTFMTLEMLIFAGEEVLLSLLHFLNEINR